MKTKTKLSVIMLIALLQAISLQAQYFYSYVFDEAGNRRYLNSRTEENELPRLLSRGGVMTYIHLALAEINVDNSIGLKPKLSVAHHPRAEARGNSYNPIV
jgi:hypothetical protein